MKNFSPQEPMDPRLIQMLETLRETPERDLDLVEQNKNQFLSELQTLPLPDRHPSVFRQFWHRLGIFSDNQHSKENNIMNTNKRRLTISLLAILAVVAIVLFGGTTATVLASQNSIPGDTLYPIKNTLEQTRLSLTRSSDARVELQLEFAEQRLQEIESLIEEGRFQNIQPAAQAFEEHIMIALEELNALAEEDPSLANELMTEITASLSRYASALGDMAGRVPEPVRSDLEDTISNIGGGNDNMNGNENFNDDFNDNDNENFNDDLNSNDNENLNDNTNENENFNDDFNENENVNDDFNDNDNENFNDDFDDNENENTNDNFNTNDNENINDDFDDDDDD